MEELRACSMSFGLSEKAANHKDIEQALSPPPRIAMIIARFDCTIFDHGRFIRH